jgi:cytidine deaminase
VNGDAMKLAAEAARANAYAPYSQFHVGAALRSRLGAIFGGANVENAAFGAGICAERSALAAAVTAGESAFDELVLVSDADEPVPPCGICRQALAEFAPSLRIVSHGRNGRKVEWSLADLLPHQFQLNALNDITE